MNDAPYMRMEHEQGLSAEECRKRAASYPLANLTKKALKKHVDDMIASVNADADPYAAAPREGRLMLLSAVRLALERDAVPHYAGAGFAAYVQDWHALMFSQRE